MTCSPKTVPLKIAVLRVLENEQSGIVFASLQPGKPNFDIYIMPRKGGQERRLTEADAKDAYPTWAR